MHDPDGATEAPEPVVTGASTDVGTQSFLAAAILGTAGSLIVALLGVVRTKGLALELDPAGLGRYGQISTILLTLSAASGLGLGLGITKVVAETRARGEIGRLGFALGLALVYPLALALVAGLLFAVSAPLAAPALLDSVEVLVIIAAAVGVPTMALQGPLLHSLQGFKDVAGAQAANVAYGVALTVATIIGVIAGGLLGAVLALSLGNGFYALVLWLRLQGLAARVGAAVRFREALGRQAVRDPLFRTLLTIGFASLIGGLFYGAAELGVRTMVLQQDSADSAGIFQALNLFSLQVFAIVGISVAFSSFPAVAAARAVGDREETARAIDDPLRLSLMLSLPLILAVGLFRDEVIELVLSTEFAPMSEYVPEQFAGDAIRVLAWALLAALIPLDLTRRWLALVFAGALAYLAVAAAYPGAPLQGAVVGYLAAWSLMAAGAAALLLRTGWWAPRRETLLALTFIIPLIALLVIEPSPLWQRAAALVTFGVLLAAVATHREERAAFLARATAVMRRRR